MSNAAKKEQKADANRLREAMKKYEMKVAHGEGLDSLVSRASRFFREKADPIDGSPRMLVECSSCQQNFFNEIVECPFCGATEEGEPIILAGGGKPPPAPSEPIVLASDLVPSRQVQTSAKLDEAVAEIHKLKATSAASYWDLGVKIKKLYDAGLWRQRLNDKGGPKWKGFDAFAQHELGIGPQNALKMMDVAANFSRIQVEAFGSKKFSLVLEAPPEDRPAIVQKIEQGASKREVEKEVRALAKEKGHRAPNRTTGKLGGSRKPKAPSATNLPPPGKPVEEKITVASILKREVVKLWQKPDKKQMSMTADHKGWKRCKRIADVPWGAMELANGVVMHFTVQAGSNGEMTLVVETKREES